MDKISTLKKLLEKIKPYRNMAEGILVLMEGGKLDENMVDYLLHFLHKITKKMETEKDISKSIQEIYEKELEEKDLLFQLKKQIIQS